MSKFFGKKAIIYRSEALFEELEERIVFDASVDPTFEGGSFFGSDLHHDWSLQYSSDPSASMDQVLGAADLAAYPGELGTPVPSITLGAVPPTNGASVVDLSSAVRVNGDPLINTMHCVITYNPRPLTSNFISSLSFAETTIFGMTIDEPTLTGPTTRSWHIDGPFDSINAILSTMQATVVPGSPAGSFAEIDITLTDPDHATNVNDAPLVDRTLLIPITAGSSSSSSSAQGPTVTLPAGGTWDYNEGLGGFQTIIPAITVADDDAHVVHVGIRSIHGQLRFNAPALPAGVSVNSMHDPVVGPPESPGARGDVVSWAYIRGPIPGVNAYLASLQYQPMPGVLPAVAITDTLQVAVDDRMAIPSPNQLPLTGGNPPWQADPVHRTTQAFLSII